MTSATPYLVPKEPGRWRAIILATLVHGALLAFLWFGVRWQSEKPASVEVEAWSPQPREAAPPLQRESEPTPEKQPEPSVKEIPRPAPVVPPAVDPDIALAKEKMRKARELKAREEERKEVAKEAAAEKKAEDKRLAQEKADATAKKKREAEAAKKEAVAKKQKQELEDEQSRAKARAEEMRRITGVAGSGSTGTAATSQGNKADAGYGQRIGAKIKSNTIFIVPDNVPRESAVEYLVELLPDGSLRGVRKLKPSGVPGFDEAVMRAIEKSAPYPPDKSGNIPSSFNVIHKPKDQ